MSKCRKPGINEWHITDDVTGLFRVSSEMVKQWNGLMAHRSIYRIKQPQESIRIPHENLAIPIARPLDFPSEDYPIAPYEN